MRTSTLLALRTAIIQAANEIREDYNDANRPHMHFDCRVSGRPDGDLKLEFHAGDYGADVCGHSLDKVVQEHLRRCGWEKINSPLMLSNADSENGDDSF